MLVKCYYLCNEKLIDKCVIYTMDTVLLDHCSFGTAFSRIFILKLYL